MTYLEMTSPDELVPAAPVPALTLAALHRDSPLISDVQAGVGAPYHWKSAYRTDEEWAVWRAERPIRSSWLLSFSGESAGIVNYDVHPGDEVEIETFGLLPEFVGRGLGGHALTLGIRQAWDLLPTVKRIWLHTSSLDHPNALPNYRRRGLRAFRVEQGERRTP